MSERWDYIAINDRGVYALCEDIVGSPEPAKFVARIKARGHRVERVPVAEAVERHKAYIATLPGFAGLVPSPAQREGR